MCRAAVNTLVPELEYMTEFMGMDLEEAESILQAAQEKQDEMAQQQDEQHQQAMQMAQQQAWCLPAPSRWGRAASSTARSPSPNCRRPVRGERTEEETGREKKKRRERGKQRRLSLVMLGMSRNIHGPAI